MRVKKIIALLASGIMCVSLAGCGSSDITLTDEQNDLIAEYISGTLLKYSYENEWKYQKLNSSQSSKFSKSSTTASQTSTQAATQEDDTEASGSRGSGATTQTTAKSSSSDLLTSLPAALGLDGVTLSYVDYVVGSVYPEDGILTVSAQTGCKVVAVRFNMTNTSGAALTLTSTTGSVSIKLAAGTSVNSYATLLKNDITSLSNVSLAAGESKEVVVLFQVKESDAGSVSGAVLSATQSQTSLGSITLQ